MLVFLTTLPVDERSKMRRVIILLAFVALALAEKTSYENYKVFRIVPSTKEQLNVLKQLASSIQGYEYWKESTELFHSADLMVAPEKLNEFTKLMNSSGMKYEVHINNVQSLIDKENPLTKDSNEFGWTSYHTLDQIYKWLDSLVDKYPENVEGLVGGKTYEGREIKGVKLSFGQNKSAVFIEGGIHAREWISPATVTYLLNEFLTSDNLDIRKLAESYDWYIFPVVNPDGYVFTHTNDRLWRKTRSKAGLFCRGVDANRNWGYEWRTAGASRIPCFPTYAGSKAFSEIETKTLSEYITSISDVLFGYIAFHSYSQLILFPYGHTTAHLDNYEELHSMGTKAVNALAKKYGTSYVTGNIAETIYKASGSSMDWAKATFKLPVAFTYELRDKGGHGFVLPAKEIIPNGEEVMDSFLAMFQEATRLGYPKPAE